MASTDTGDLGTLTMISAAPVNPGGSGTIRYIKTRWQLNTTGATESLVGFEVWHDNGGGSTTPNWVDAADCKVAGDGDDGSPTTIYEALIPTPLATTGATWWETFEEYVASSVDGDDMNGGGLMWSGSWA